MRTAILIAVFSAAVLAQDIGHGAFPATTPPDPLNPVYPVDGFATYTSATYPDSLLEVAACKIGRPGLACDPNSILANKGNITANHELLERMTERLRKTTPCMCAANDGRYGACVVDSTGGGFTLNVALMKKMQLDPSTSSKVDRIQAAATFADDLRKRLHRGQCEDDILLLYSRDDHVMWTSVGIVAERYLSQEVINAVTLNAEVYFKKDDFTKGLNYTIDMYTRVLRKESVDLEPPAGDGWYWPIPFWAVIVIGVVILIIAIVIVGFAIYGCVKCCCLKDRRREYQMGTRISRN